MCEVKRYQQKGRPNHRHLHRRKFSFACCLSHLAWRRILPLATWITQRTYIGADTAHTQHLTTLCRSIKLNISVPPSFQMCSFCACALGCKIKMLRLAPEASRRLRSLWFNQLSVTTTFGIPTALRREAREGDDTATLNVNHCAR